MNLHYKGMEVHFNPWMHRENIFKTDDNQIIMHPYAGACLILEIHNYDYSDVFKVLGVTDDAIDACIDSAKKKIHTKLELLWKR